MSYEPEVALGAEWLDANVPGWEAMIDLGTLEMASGCRCILGQLDRASPSRTASFLLFLRSKGLDTLWAAEHGFTFLAAGPADWEALEDTWIALVKERHDSGLLSDGASA